MNKICTSIEQSKHLIELGVEESTADLTYSGNILLIHDDNSKRGTKELPAWSLEALLNQFECVSLTRDVEWEAKINYVEDDYINEHSEYGKTALEAVYKLVCWSLENKVL